MDPIETTAVIFGFLCVVFTIRQNIWCWPTGLVQVFLYIFVFYRVKLYSDMILHVIYVYMQIYGWHNWLRGGENSSELPVSNLAGKALAAGIVLCAVATASAGYAMASFTDASVPYFDAFTTAASLIAQWLMANTRNQRRQTGSVSVSALLSISSRLIILNESNDVSKASTTRGSKSPPFSSRMMA